jgi:hypothetical protein
MSDPTTTITPCPVCGMADALLCICGAPASVQRRDNGQWVVMYRGTVVGRHRAKFRALAQAESLNRH